MVGALIDVNGQQQNNGMKAAATLSETPGEGIVSGQRYLAPETLEIRVRKAASGLHDLGVWQGDQVAILMRNVDLE